MEKPTTPPHYPVVIIGGGIGGLTLAAALRQTQVDFRVLERFPRVKPEGAGISLAPNCLRALEQLGIFDKIAANSQQLYGIDIYGEQEYWGRLDFGLSKNWFGYHVRSMERHEFHHLLYDAADGDNTVELGWNVVDIVDDASASSVRVISSDGREMTADLVVGADGIRSITRRTLARKSGLNGLNTIRFTGRVHMSGYTAPLKHLGEREAGIANWVLYPDSVLTTWPCTNNRQWFIGVKAANLAPGETPDRSVWKGTTPDMINEVYGQRFHPFGKDGKVHSLVDRAERVVASNVFEEHDFPTMVKGRIALVGDAAHSMTSFFGQGACQAIEDAVELANAIGMVYAPGKRQEGLEQSMMKNSLEQYRSRREARAKALVSFSGAYARLHTAKMSPWPGHLLRWLVYRYVPSSCWMWYLRWLWGYQPTVDLLPPCGPSNVWRVE